MINTDIYNSAYITNLVDLIHPCEILNIKDTMPSIQIHALTDCDEHKTFSSLSLNLHLKIPWFEINNIFSAKILLKYFYSQREKYHKTTFISR